MSPNDTFRPALSLPVEQAMSFLSLASRHIPRAEQLDTARDLGLSTTPAVDENGFSETALALWESMNRASAIMTMASMTPTQPTHRNLRIWLGRPYATVARTGGVWVFRTVCFERVVLSSPGCLWPGRMDDHEEVLEAHA